MSEITHKIENNNSESKFWKDLESVWIERKLPTRVLELAKERGEDPKRILAALAGSGLGTASQHGLMEAMQAGEGDRAHAASVAKLFADAVIAVGTARDAMLRLAQAHEDADTRVIRNVQELVDQALRTREKGLLKVLRDLVNQRDRVQELGLAPLQRTGARRGGGSPAELWRKLEALVKRGRDQGKQVLEDSLLRGTGVPALPPREATPPTRILVATVLGHHLRMQFAPGITLAEAAGRVYATMPHGSSRQDRAGAFRDDVFKEDPARTVTAAFRAFGFSEKEIDAWRSASRQRATRARQRKKKRSS